VDVWADLPGRVERGFLFYEVDVFVPLSAHSVVSAIPFT
jgi:hypothetical protein